MDREGSPKEEDEEISHSSNSSNSSKLYPSSLKA
jgi:hypothetical protein